MFKFSVILIFIAIQGSESTYPDLTQFLHIPQMSCTINSNGQKGICRKFSECPSAQSAYYFYSVNPVFCHHFYDDNYGDRLDPIVCCDSSLITKVDCTASVNQNIYKPPVFDTGYFYPKPFPDRPTGLTQNGVSGSIGTGTEEIRPTPGLIHTPSGQDRTQQGPQFQNCRVNSKGDTGVCRRYSQCPEAQSALINNGIAPIYCQYHRTDPVVCCPSIEILRPSTPTQPSTPSTPQLSTPTNQPSTPISQPSTPIRQPSTPIKQSSTPISPSSTSKRPPLSHMHSSNSGPSNPTSQLTTLSASSNSNRKPSPVPPDLFEGNKTSQRLCREVFQGHSHFIPVVGGSPAKSNEFPFMCPIGYRKSSGPGYDFKCGGALISETFILSAAHCASVGGAPPDVARVGSISLYDTTSDQFPDIPIIRVFIHPDYNKREVYNDIALFELGVEQWFHRAACLWAKPVISVSDVIAMGFGDTQFAGPSSNDLLKVDLKLYSNEECSKSYPKGEYRIRRGIIESQVCAGDPEGRRDTCQGDSGGPLIVRSIINGTSLAHLVGITSFGQGCAGGPPSIYTRVSSFVDWIESVVWPNL